jgi:hypothetical protein
MNNIYVDELPKNCKGCLLHNEDNGWCQVLICYTDDVPSNCPLKPLTDRLAEERKKVVQEIREWCKESFDYTKLPNELGCWVAVNREEFFNILDQIERGDL